MIEKLNPDYWVGRPVQEPLITIINELVEEVNRLGKEPVPHAHRDLRRGGPHPDFNLGDYIEENK